jgi:PIN domain nuclease of toxin-antitoxin system
MAWCDSTASRKQCKPGLLSRLIVATALEHKLTLVTHDKEISRWGGVPVFW